MCILFIKCFGILEYAQQFISASVLPFLENPSILSLILKKIKFELQNDHSSLYQFHWQSINVSYEITIYRVFRLDSPFFVLQVQQHKLDSCSMGCLFKTLQRLCYKHLNFFIFKKFKAIFKKF